MKYNETLTTLFDLLSLANRADSPEYRESWQLSKDCFGSELIDGTIRPAYFYGHIAAAIREIAGQTIIDHWAHTNEIDYSLANRLTKEFN